MAHRSRAPRAMQPNRPPEGRLESGLGFRMGRVYRMLRASWEEQILDLGVSPPQAALLRAVYEWPESGLRELARRARTDVMNAKRLVDRLEVLGLVQAGGDPGHRQRRLFRPTTRGVALAEEVARRAGSWNRRLSSLLGAEEMQQLHRLLGNLETALESLTPALSRPTRVRSDREDKR